MRADAFAGTKSRQLAGSRGLARHPNGRHWVSHPNERAWSMVCCERCLACRIHRETASPRPKAGGLWERRQYFGAMTPGSPCREAAIGFGIYTLTLLLHVIYFCRASQTTNNHSPVALIKSPYPTPHAAFTTVDWSDFATSHCKHSISDHTLPHNTNIANNPPHSGETVVYYSTTKVFIPNQYQHGSTREKGGMLLSV